MESRLWKLLWDFDPNGLLVLDTQLEIVQTNAAFCALFRTTDAALHGRPAWELLGDMSDFEKALREQVEVLGGEQEYPQHDLYVRKVIFPVPGEGLVAGIFVDMTAAWRQRQDMKELRERAVMEVRQVVDKQMSVAQEIAGLLGETTAETKVGLLRLLETIRREDDETPPFFDVYSQSLNHHGEELCGDQVRILRTADRTIVVLSDGLGSGVKANILARLTAEIIVTMIREAALLEDVMETVLGTLPVCKVRKIAYATFLVVEIQHWTGAFRVVSFDSPEPFYLKRNELAPLPTRRQSVHGKELLFSEGTLAEGDFLGLASDGVLFAGMGGLMSFGWGREQIGAHLESALRLRAWTAQAAVASVIEKTRTCYGSHIGDDATFVGILARSANRLMVFTGPPVDRSIDERCVERLLAFGGRKVVCGGTTAKVVGEHLGEMVGTDIATVREDVPPIGSLSAIDLVTEGILTLAGTLKLLLECGGNPRRLPEDRNGTVLLARELLRADAIFFLAGSQVNPFYQNPLLPKSVSIRRSVLDQIVDALRGFHKEVTVEWC